MAKITDRLHGYARLGAAIRRAELVAELHAIAKAFPDLRFQKRTAALLKTSGSIATAASVNGGRARRPQAPEETKAHAGRKEVHQRTDEEILAARRKKEA